MAEVIIAQLETARSRIETKFSEAGGFLQETLEKIDQQLAVLRELGKALDPEAVGSATRDLLATSDSLYSVSTGLAAREKRMQSLKRQSNDLRTHLLEMHGLLRYLRAFAFNVKITAAGMGVQAQQFGNFSTEMGNRIDHGEKQIDEFRICLLQLERHIDSALVSEHALAAQAQSMLPSVPQGLANDATAMEKFHLQAASSTTVVASLAQRIQMCILNALSALQIGDTVRQRIEHVQLGLAALSELDAQLVGTTSPELRRRLDEYVCAMLAAQLEDTAETFEAEADRMLDLMGQMAEDTSKLAEALDFDGASSKRGGLRSLEQSVAQAQVLVRGMDHAATEADGLQSATSNAVDGLLARVASLKQVKDDVQYMALNTSLRCVHIGDAGRPLQVVATELSAYAKNLEAAAAVTLTSVEALASTNSEGRDQEGAGSLSQEKLESAVTRLRAAANVVEHDLSGAMVQGQQLASKLGNAEHKLNFRAELVDVVFEAAEALAARAGETSDATDIERPLAEIMARIAKSYTMARERQVHAQFMPAEDEKPAVPAQPAEAEEEAFEMFA